MKIISCQGVSKKYKEHTALENVTFSVEGVGCVGFLGANGAGKTTTIRILSGLAKPTTGIVEVVGYDVTKDINKIRKELGYCPQTPTFYNYMTGMEWMEWVGLMFKMDKNIIKTRSEELLKMCGIWEARDRRIGGYSGGMKQRLGIAQALINNPKLLILDEPVSALDPMGRHDVLMLIEKLKDKMTIFMSTHILEDVERVADKVVIIDKGTVIMSDTMEQLIKKYSKQTIQFEIEKTDKDIEKLLIDKPWVVKVEKEGNKFSITTNKLEEARKNLLELIKEEKLGLISFVIKSATLEDVFLKVVSNQ